MAWTCLANMIMEPLNSDAFDQWLLISSEIDRKRIDRHASLIRALEL